ncbi:MAG: metallophosphoesterase, partial [Myxococcota bacterium]|nr:metallophosphoesterase [Myxococcota bacterium]
MRVIALEETPIHQVSYRTVGAGGRVAFRSAPVVTGWVDALPGALQALVVTSDLQGVSPVDSDDEPPALAGVLAAEDLGLLCACDELPPAEATGVLLAGDLYARPQLDRRGGRGDSRPVWRAFAERFRWVAGVPGNHDGYGATVEEVRAFQSEPGIHLLDGDTVHLDGLDIAGVGGIVGNPRRDHRRDQ